jgi:hypothetical protein
MQALNVIDFTIIDQDFSMKILSYNQIKMIFTYFWDYPVQIYPQVDLVISNKLSCG